MSLKGVSSGILVMIERGRCLVGGLSQVLVLDNQAWGGVQVARPQQKDFRLQGALAVFPPKPSAGFLRGQGQESSRRGAALFPGWYILGIKNRGQGASVVLQKGNQKL